MTTQPEFQHRYHPDDWSETADHHHHVERAVQPGIVQLVKWATETVPPNHSSAVLDDGCDVGTVTAEIKKSFPDLSVVAIDSSAGMLDVFNRKAKELNWKNVVTKLLDGADLTDIPSASITHAFACTYIDLSHDAKACIDELHRVLAADGILAITTWTDPTHPSIGVPWTKACQKLHPDFKTPIVTSPHWTTPKKIKDNLEKAGLKDVQTKQIMTHWRWDNPEDMTGWFFDTGNPVCKRWRDALAQQYGGDVGNIRELFHEELEKEYKEEGGQLLGEELVNLTIARK